MIVLNAGETHAFTPQPRQEDLQSAALLRVPDTWRRSLHPAQGPRRPAVARPEGSQPQGVEPGCELPAVGSQRVRVDPELVRGDGKILAESPSQGLGHFSYKK